MEKKFRIFRKFIFSVIALILFLPSCSYIASKVIKLNNLPESTGEYSVGTKIFTWTDQSREESFTSDVMDKRKIAVQVWYPIEKKSIVRMNYIDYPNKRIGPISEQFSLMDVSPIFVATLMSDVRNVKTNSEYDAEIISNSLNKYPLIIFSHGLGGMKNQNSIQVEELVSQGYIVVAPDHSYDANITIFTNGEIAPFKSSEYDPRIKYSIEDFYAYRIPQIQTRSYDLTFILDTIDSLQLDVNEKIWNMIDFNKIGVFGHSFGGGTTLLTIYNDHRVDAGIALDGWIEPIPNEVISSGIDKPFLYIGRTEWEDTLNYYKLNKLIDNSQGNGKKILLPGTEHFDYTDTPYFHTVTKTIKVSGSMPTNVIVDTLNHYLVKFFNKHLKDI